MMDRDEEEEGESDRNCIRGKSQWTLVREGTGKWMRWIWIFTRVNLIATSVKGVKG